jgi:putative FmdB family regulatory protein
MPIYEYSCVGCTARWKEMHGADDKGGPCPQCGLQGRRSMPMGTTYTVTARGDNHGQRVEKFIEESRQVLEEQMREARQEYKP